MALSLGANISALTAQRHLSTAGSRSDVSIERLSSGLRINRPSDDASGLAVAMQLNARVRTYGQAVLNVNDGISVLNVAEQALGSLNDILSRQAELAEQAANGIYSATQRAALQSEAAQLSNEYNRIVSTTTFNGRNLLDGANGKLGLQVGVSSGASSVISVDLDGLTTSASLTLSQTAVTTAESGACEVDNFDFSSSAGNGEFSAVTFGDGSSVTGGDYFNFETFHSGIRSDFYVWLNTGGTTDPGGVGSGIEVLINSGDSGETIASTVSAALSALGDLDGMSFVANGATVEMTNLNQGNVADTQAYGSIGTAPNVQGSGIAPGDYFVFSTAGNGINNYVVWYADIFGFGMPSGPVPGRTGIEVTVNPGDSATEIRDATLAAMNAIVDTGVNLSTSGAAGLTVTSTGRAAVSAPSGINVGVSQTVAGVTSQVNVVSDALAISSHGYATGTALDVSSNGALPGGMTVGTYYAISVNSNTLKLADSYANAMAGTAINLTSWGTGTMTLSGSGTSSGTLTGSSAVALNLSSAGGARLALDAVQAQRQIVAGALGSIGASQSRLTSSLQTLFVAKENTSAAHSRITDIDVAAESAEFIRSRILKESAAAVMAQANQQPAIALTLL